jgi:hypothetical protein
MTAELIAAVDASPIAGPRKHSWPRESSEPLPAWKYADGNARHYRICRHCGMAKITVHSASGWARREWQTANGMKKTAGGAPPCSGAEKSGAKQ